MPDFGFVGASYEAPSITQDAQECINWYPEIDPTKPQGERGVVALYPTPGLTSLVALPSQQPVRGMRTVSGGKYMIVVCGAYVYALDSGFQTSIVGQLNSISGPVGITDNGTNVYIVDGAYRYTWRISTPTVARFLGTVSGNILTVTRNIIGIVQVDQSLFGFGVPEETVIIGGSGNTWTLNKTFNINEEVTFNVAKVAGVITASSAGTVLTVTNVNFGTIYPGQTLTDDNGSLIPSTIVTSLGDGIVINQTIVDGGSKYAVNDTISLQGGIYGVSPATYVVTGVDANGKVTDIKQTFPGQYSSQPINPVSSTSNGQGTGLTLNVVFGNGTGAEGTYTISTTDTTPPFVVPSEKMYLLNFSVLPTSDGAFAGGTVVDVLDNYFIYNRPDTQQWAVSDILSPITYPLSFASKFTSPDNLVSLIANNGQVYLLGEKSSEVWSDQGTFPFAFQRIPASASQHGIISAFSVARVGNTFCYLAQNSRGQAEIVIMNGYYPERISTHAVENTLVNKNLKDAIAWTYQLEGHETYVISFPKLDLTWAYDFTTKLWHKWLWTDNLGKYRRHRGNCASFFQNKVCVGDWENGQIYYLDPDNYTDNGQNIRRIRRCPHLTTDLQRMYFDELQIQFQPGVGYGGFTIPVVNSNYVYLGNPYYIRPNAALVIVAQEIAVLGVGNQITKPDTYNQPQAMLRWSNDGGNTWSNEYWQKIGGAGKFLNRAIWRRLGWSRDRVFEVSVTDPVKAVIVSANLKASAGDN